MARNKQTGGIGEELAAKYLESLGMCVIARNWHTAKAEIDIIAIKDYTLRIVEVKTRTKESESTISTSLNEAKLRQLIKGAGEYVKQNPIEGLSDIYFDLVQVVFSNDLSEHTIEYTPEFFYPSW